MGTPYYMLNFFNLKLLQKIRTIIFFKRWTKFQCSVRHMWHLEIVSLSKQVKSWTNWKINNSSQILRRSEVTGRSVALQLERTAGEYRKSQLIEAWHLCRNQCQGRRTENINWWIAGGSMCTHLRVKSPQRPSHARGRGGWTTWWVFYSLARWGAR